MIQYPGFTLEDYFTVPAVNIPACRSTNLIGPGQVKFEFNKFGYRTMEFDSVPDDYFLVLGCSLTEGHGLESDETWAYYVSQDLETSVVNLGKGSGNAEFCCHNLKQWVSFNKNPKATIIQWPNPFRMTLWNQDRAMFYTSQNANLVFNENLRLSEINFWKVWLNSIIDANNYCKIVDIPILNICFESADSIPLYILDILAQNKIEFHIDQKIEGKTWFFDSNAKDKQHHSSWCNRKWADRILTLLN
jgi:hypothetical protein